MGKLMVLLFILVSGPASMKHEMELWADPRALVAVPLDGDLTRVKITIENESAIGDLTVGRLFLSIVVTD